MGKRKARSNHSPAFKAQVALAALRNDKTVPELSQQYRVHANQIYKWKAEAIEKMALLFERSGSKDDGGASAREDEHLRKIGELTVERDFLLRGLERIR